jgi:hypothetical protein
MAAAAVAVATSASFGDLDRFHLFVPLVFAAPDGPLS